MTSMALASASERIEFVHEVQAKLNAINEVSKYRGVWAVKSNQQLQVGLDYIRPLVRNAGECSTAALNLLRDLNADGLSMLNVDRITVYGLPQIQITPFSDPERGGIFLSATTGNLLRVQASPTEKCGNVSEPEPQPQEGEKFYQPKRVKAARQDWADEPMPQALPDDDPGAEFRFTPTVRSAPLD